MEYDFYVKVITIILALSGWFKVAYDHWTSKPRISGRILTVIRGGGQHSTGVNMSIFFVYAYILNTRKNAVHILDYKLSVRRPGSIRWHTLTRAYGMEKIKSMSFTHVTGEAFSLGDFSQNLIYMKKSPAQYGIPLHGWVPFVSTPERGQWEKLRFKLECTDAYGKNHVIKDNDKDFISNMLLVEMAGVEFPDSMLKGKLQ